MTPDLPDLPPELVAECIDPGVGPIDTVGDAVKVLGENRVYAACNRKKHRDTKAFYRLVQTNFLGAEDGRID